jgi:excisionase family DNA binding protein
MASNSGDNPESKFLTVAEVAAMMRVSKMTVYRLVHNGELPAVRVGRSFRVLETDVDEYLRKSFYNAGGPTATVPRDGTGSTSDGRFCVSAYGG